MSAPGTGVVIVAALVGRIATGAGVAIWPARHTRCGLREQVRVCTSPDAQTPRELAAASWRDGERRVLNEIEKGEWLVRGCGGKEALLVVVPRATNRVHVKLLKHDLRKQAAQGGVRVEQPTTILTAWRPPLQSSCSCPLSCCNGPCSCPLSCCNGPGQLGPSGLCLCISEVQSWSTPCNARNPR